jgi:hypothetical protein
MKAKILVPAITALFFAWGSAFAADGKVTIISVAPSDIYAKDKISVKYEADVGSTGDHLHLNVDGKRVDVIHELKGVAMVDPLPSGKHHICLAVNTKSHVPTGVESCVDVTVW